MLANPDLFTDRWARELGRELAGSEPYRRAAGRWEGAIVLELAPGDGVEEARAVFLDLAHGECHAARSASEEDREAARFVISGDAADWQALLAGEMAPVAALLRGKLALAKGSVSSLLPHTAAARELLNAAKALEEPRAGEGDGEPAAAGSRPEPAEPPPFQSTSPVGLRRDLPPMRLWEKAKRRGIWNPSDIDFETDREDWSRLDERERDLLLHLASLFTAGEESVSRDLLPLVQVIAAEGRLEEELFLAAFLWEEAKHVDAFRRFLDEVAQDSSDLARYHTPSYRRIFYEELPAAMGRLRTDASPRAQAEASSTYNLIVEGVLAETGYHVYRRVLVENGILPGMQELVGHLESDEARHLAYGVFLLSRLVAEHGDPVWRAIETRMEDLVEPAVAIIYEVFDRYADEGAPFGLEPAVFADFALGQFEKRLTRVERARRQSLEEVLGGGD